jgi:hypothetical protein
LRYELRREFAPYIGITYEKNTEEPLILPAEPAIRSRIYGLPWVFACGTEREVGKIWAIVLPRTITFDIPWLQRAITCIRLMVRLMLILMLKPIPFRKGATPWPLILSAV